MSDIEKIDSKVEIPCLNWTMNYGRRKVFVNYKTDSDKLNIVIFHFRNSIYLKDV